MKRSATPIQFLASEAAKTSSMSSRSSYRGGTKQWGRGFSHCPYKQGRGQLFVTEDSLFQSVQDSDLGNGQAGSGGFDPRQLPPSPRFNPNQRFRQPTPFFQNQYQNQKHQFRRSSRFDHNSQAIRPPQQFRPRPPKPSDYRDWEYAETGPPPNSEKFIVLSYNILADYLAINHRSKLYFHIPRYMLDWGWRKRSILFELNLWSADIMCLQEVDRFQDLAEDLKLRGYDGIWKMRTGNAIDGCAIFWRTSRFKLLYEEAIEFNKLGLRDNVAQICVLEHLTDKNCPANTSDVSIRSESSDKVVVCNIHVLFNPKRGEIKLGQVRTLLDNANAVAKMWNAPVVLCGDFNCTPKSPLYNFILEQKLELSGIDRDKVSGQASAEIRASNPNPNPNANPVPHWQKQNNPYKNEGTIPTTDGNSLLQSIRSIIEVPDTSLSAQPSGKVDTAIGSEKTKATLQDVINSCKENTASNISVLADSFNKDLTISQNECELRICQLDGVNCNSTSTLSYDIEDSQHDNNQMQQSKSYCPPHQGSYYRHSGIIDDSEIRDPNTDKLAQPAEVPPLESFSYLSSQPIDSDENADLLAPSRADVSNIPLSISSTGKNELDDASPQEVNLQQEGEMLVEDQSVSLHDTKISSQPDSRRSGQSNNQNEFASDSIDSNADSADTEVLNDFSNDLDSDFAIVDRTAYDPSLWTPVEVAVATGNADCMFLEHPLKLKSSYAEVKDCSGTRDPNGEPLVTSYNRCFLGTVDYIWLSEGLQIVRVLAPIPKHAMQWTPGFPTKKWGSDHIALASEMAFTKDGTNKAMEVQHHKE